MRNNDTPEYELRPASEEDSDLAFRILESALGPYIAEQYGWDEDEQRRMHAERFRPGSTWIIVCGGSDAGLITVDRHPDHIHLRQLFILREAQGKGIGSRPLNGLVSEADQRGVPVKLRVLKVNHRAIDFYARHGFSICGETETHHLVEYRPRG